MFDCQRACQRVLEITNFKLKPCSAREQLVTFPNHGPAQMKLDALQCISGFVWKWGTPNQNPIL